MAEYVARFISDERLQCALFTAGTASVHFHHSSGRMFGNAGMWGYVKGGMGRVSHILAEIAELVGVCIVTGAAVGRIVPGTGVELEAG
jgi:phytoene dehydrogenase-like protein